MTQFLLVGWKQTPRDKVASVHFASTRTSIGVKQENYIQGQPGLIRRLEKPWYYLLQAAVNCTRLFSPFSVDYISLSLSLATFIHHHRPPILPKAVSEKRATQKLPGACSCLLCNSRTPRHQALFCLMRSLKERREL